MSNRKLRSLILLTAMMGLSGTDVLGAEPLPPRALAHIGDHRFYHGPGITCIALSPDGRYAASAARYLDSNDITEQDRSKYDPIIALWDIATGERLRELRVPHGFASRLAFSADGKRLAASYEISDEKSGVVLFDILTGKLIRRLGVFPAQIGCLQFSPDGKQLRVSEWGGPLSAWDAATGKRLRLWKQPAERPPSKGKVGMSAVESVLSPDGRLIVWEMCGYSKGGCASSWMEGLRVHDAETNKFLYEKKYKEDDEEIQHDEFLLSFAFTADGTRLVADCCKLLVWESATGKELGRRKVPGMRRFALAPDGRRAAIEEVVKDRTTTRLRLWDLKTGKPLRELVSPFDNVGAGPPSVSPIFSIDGKKLLAASDSTLRLFDAKTGEEQSLPGHRTPVTPRFSADGRTLFTSCEEQRCRWNVSGQKPISLNHERRKAWEVECLAHSADDQLFLDYSSELAVRVRETATGRVLHTLPENAYVHFATFSPDATRLLLYYVNSEGWANFKLYDVKTGKKLAKIRGMANCDLPIFSPNGQLVAWVEDTGIVHLHDANTGKSEQTLRPCRPLRKSDKIESHFNLCFSPDGAQLIATGWLMDHSDPGSESPIRLPARVFDVASGREITQFYTHTEKTSNGPALLCTACSRDGRLLAVAEKYSGMIRVLEIASGKTRFELTGHRYGVHGLDFAPDGRTLASGGQDNVVFLWDVYGTSTPAVKSTHESDLASLWNDLASEDAKQAGVAIASLLRKSEASVAFLRKRLHPADALDHKRLAQWIADLDGDVFEIREAASRELTRLGERAEADLRHELTNRPSLEMRRRIEVLLDQLGFHTLPPETLRTLRAIEVLEHIGTPDARRCLEMLAKGASDARPTRDAKAALRRLTHRRD